MKIVALSDLHGDLIVDIPECDVVCIAGDIVPLKMQRNPAQTFKWIKNEFMQWVNELPCKDVILVAGNHDFWFDTNYWSPADIPTARQFFAKQEKVTYLEDSGCEIDGIKFYGSPWITGLPGWAFFTKDDSQYFNHIPEDTDVLITHAPAYGEVGTVLQQCWNHGNNYGSEALRNVLENSNIRYCLSGHIHSGCHAGEKIGNAMCYNVSVKDERYNIAFWPLELDI